MHRWCSRYFASYCIAFKKFVWLSRYIDLISSITCVPMNHGHSIITFFCFGFVLACLQCSGCGEDFYCGGSCQKKHWPQHKFRCQQYKQLITYAAKRWHYVLDNYRDSKQSGEMPCYFGTDFAIDYLALRDNEWAIPYKDDDLCLAKDYSILSAGCGDIRSLVFTIGLLTGRVCGTVAYHYVWLWSICDGA